MNKKERTKIYFDFLKKRTALAKKSIDLSVYRPKAEKVLSPKVIAIKKAINDGDFGCKREAVYNLVNIY